MFLAKPEIIILFTSWRSGSLQYNNVEVDYLKLFTWIIILFSLHLKMFPMVRLIWWFSNTSLKYENQTF